MTSSTLSEVRVVRVVAPPVKTAGTVMATVGGGTVLREDGSDVSLVSHQNSSSASE